MGLEQRCGSWVEDGDLTDLSRGDWQMRIGHVVCGLGLVGGAVGVCVVGYHVALRALRTAEYSPMHIAVIDNDIAGVRRLIELGECVNAQGGKYGYTPLGLATAYRNREIAELLIVSGADVDLASPLRIAARQGDVEFTTLLLSHGARVDGAPSATVSPLFMAATHGQGEVGRLLIARGADVNYRSSHVCGATVLRRAAASAPLSLIALMLEKGARVNEADEGGRTALHDAAARGRLDVTRLLVRFGAARDAVDEDGHTPASLAKKHGQRDVFKFLTEDDTE